jgi:hypothetical protein
MHILPKKDCAIQHLAQLGSAVCPHGIAGCRKQGRIPIFHIESHQYSKHTVAIQNPWRSEASIPEMLDSARWRLEGFSSVTLAA